MIRELLGPFSEKYCLRSERDSGDYIRFLIDTDLHWHWPNPSIANHGCPRFGKFFQKVNANFDNACNLGNPLFTDDEHPCVVQQQAEWTMDDCMNEFDPMKWHHRDDRQRSDFNQDGGECAGWRPESLAYYAPAHTAEIGSYGIHLKEWGVIQVVKFIESNLLPGKISREVLILTATYCILAHEYCHAWIEDIVSLVEFSMKLPSDSVESPYRMTQKKCNGYIFMEEAICNTAAFGLLSQFLIRRKSEDTDVPTYNSAKLLNAFGKFMLSQPRGYNNFCQIKSFPHRNEKFIKNLFRLLVQVYGLEPRLVTSAIDLVFGCETSPHGKFFAPGDEGRWSVLWTAAPPLHNSPK